MASPLHTLLVTALGAEARPIVRHFGMTKDTTETTMEVFQGDGLALLVTGVGKVRAAMSTASFLSRQPDVSGIHIINVGIAGATKRDGQSKGDLFLVNRVLDEASDREFFPDLLLNTAFREVLLTTVDRPVADGRAIDGLVDMEGAGVFEAAAAYVGPHRISIMKIVSDHMDGTKLKKETISALVEKHMPDIDRFIALAHTSGAPPLPVIGEAEAQWLKHVTSSLRLTASQAQQLRKWAAAYVVCRRRKLPRFSRNLLERPHDTRERSARLEAIKRRLATEE